MPFISQSTYPVYENDQLEFRYKEYNMFGESIWVYYIKYL